MHGRLIAAPHLFRTLDITSPIGAHAGWTGPSAWLAGELDSWTAR